MKKIRAFNIIILVLLSLIMLFYAAYELVAVQINKVYYRFSLLTIVLLFALVVFAVIQMKKKWALHIIYMIAASLLGIILSFMIPIYEVPDEPAHIATAYYVSDFFLGIKTDHENVLMRTDDAIFPETENPNDMEDMEKFIRSIFVPLNDDSLIESGNAALDTFYYQYFFSSLGLSIGRLLCLGSGLTFYLARFLNGLFFVALMTWSIKKIPVGKEMLFTIGLFPMTLQQAFSFSYDSFVIGGAICIASLTVLALQENSKITKIELLVLTILCSLYVPIKGHTYFLLAFMPILIWIKWRKSSEETNRRLARFAIVMVSLVLFVFIMEKIFTIINSPQIVQVEGYENYISWANTEGYTINYFLEDPFEFVNMMFRTFHAFLAKYILGIVGAELGYFEIFASETVSFALVICLLISATLFDTESFELSELERIYLLFAGLTGIGFPIIGMLLEWTPITSPVVIGVQGRYFLPILVPFIFSLRRGRINGIKGMEYELVMVEVVLLYFDYICLLSRVI